MNEEKNLTSEVALTPHVKRIQTIAWTSLLLGLIFSAISPRLLFMEPLMILVAFANLRKVASNQVMELCCKRMMWVQGVLAAILLVGVSSWMDFGGDVLAVDFSVAVAWLASVWCYGAIAKSGTLSKESLGWLNVIVTLVVVRTMSISLLDYNFVEAFGALYFGFVFVVAYAWYRLIHSEAFVGKDLVPTDVEPSKAFGLVNKYTILGLVPIVVMLLIMMLYM